MVFQNGIRVQAGGGALVQLVQGFQRQVEGYGLVGDHRGGLLQWDLLTEAVSWFAVQSPLLQQAVAGQSPALLEAGVHLRLVVVHDGQALTHTAPGQGLLILVH